ncbi:MAG: hypothetical protein K2M45_08230 [Muribaculaceae bacterium]|nr:hypothetical protein [Muribaculaceae bacterium]
MQSIHISQARRILNSPEIVSLGFLTAKGEIRRVRCVSLKWDFKTGTRTVKCIPSNQIRRVRDALIFEINDIEVYF